MRNSRAIPKRGQGFIKQDQLPLYILWQNLSLFKYVIAPSFWTQLLRLCCSRGVQDAHVTMNMQIILVIRFTKQTKLTWNKCVSCYLKVDLTHFNRVGKSKCHDWHWTCGGFTWKVQNIDAIILKSPGFSFHTIKSGKIQPYLDNRPDMLTA